MRFVNRTIAETVILADVLPVAPNGTFEEARAPIHRRRRRLDACTHELPRTRQRTKQ